MDVDEHEILSNTTLK